MRRLSFAARPHARERLEDVGFSWHDLGGEEPYWAEDAAYVLSAEEAGVLQRAGQELVDRVLEATGVAIEDGRLSELGIPAWLHGAVQASWDRDDPSVYMRLDLAWDGVGAPRLLEVNGQTPTSLLEAAVCQWHWLEDRRARGELSPAAGQWNTIHEGLGEQWAHLLEARGVHEVHFASARDTEDLTTLTYLRELAREAGVRTQHLPVDRVGTSPEMTKLADEWAMPISHLFWLWPFEFAWESRDAQFLASTETRFVEPLWKAATSSKGLLPLLHELFPRHPGILGAQRQGDLGIARLGPRVVTKPMFSREGQNVALPGEAPTPGAYSDLAMIEQEYAELPEFHVGEARSAGSARYPIFGVWVAGGEVCGLGIREGRTRVTDNRASFVPHVVLP